VFLVGGACWALDPLSRPPNLVPFYEVEDAVKDDVLRLTDVAINPIISGSGTNLKMLEYMAWGLPVVATPKGVRGLALAQNVHAVVTDRENFAKAIRSLASDPERCESIGASARALVETQFDWNRIAASTFFALLSGGKDAESASQP
jgi:glycosyltransferase involved in cell wall biosynthesis